MKNGNVIKTNTSTCSTSRNTFWDKRNTENSLGILFIACHQYFSLTCLLKIDKIQSKHSNQNQKYLSIDYLHWK